MVTSFHTNSITQPEIFVPLSRLHTVNANVFCIVDVNVKILNGGAWGRASERISVSLPSALEDCMSNVEDYYRNKHRGRKLQWNNLMSNGTVCALQSCVMILSCTTVMPNSAFRAL